jgi:hypothetical protein
MFIIIRQSIYKKKKEFPKTFNGSYDLFTN